MSAETAPADTGTAAGDIGLGWRGFQVIGLVVALSWIVSYVNIGGYAFLFTGGGPPGLPGLAHVVFFLSPVVSLVLIVLAVKPDWLDVATEDSTRGTALRAAILLLPLLWMVNVFVGWVMVDNLITQPLAPSKALPVYAGTFLHVVFQHWFQSLAALVLALVPDQFAALTESPTPAGIQCAVVDCE